MADPNLNENFSSYPQGKTPPTDYWKTTYHKDGDTKPFAYDKNSFVVGGSGGDTWLQANKSQDDMHAHYDYGDASHWQNYDYSGRIMASTGNNIGFTWYSSYLDNRDNYYRISTDNKNPAWHVVFHPHGSAPLTGILTTTKIPKPNTWYRFRVQVTTEIDRTNTRARIWADGEKEPDTWDIEFHDDRNNRPTQGTVGFWTTQATHHYYTGVVVAPFTGTIDDTINPPAPIPTPTPNPTPAATGAAPSINLSAGGDIFVVVDQRSDEDGSTKQGFLIRQTDRLHFYGGYSDNGQRIRALWGVLPQPPEAWIAQDDSGTYYPVVDALNGGDVFELIRYAYYVGFTDYHYTTDPAHPEGYDKATALMNAQAMSVNRPSMIANMVASLLRDGKRLFRFDQLNETIVNDWQDPKNMSDVEWWGTAGTKTESTENAD